MKTETWNIERLVPYARNPRKNDGAVDKVAASLKEFGFRQPIVVDTEGVIIAGHTRYKAAKKLGMAEVPVHIASELTPAQVKAYRIADNKVGELAEWDDELLALEIEDLKLEDYDIELTGFNVDELPGVGADTEVDAEPKIDKAEELRVKWGVEPGQLWELGDHRLLCGDSTKKEDVERVMGGERADLCFTSPPYALGKSVALSGNKSMSAKGNAYKDHEDTGDQWDNLMREWFASSECAVKDVWIINVQPLAGNKRDLIKFIAERADRLVDIATWDKGHAQPPMAQGVMASRFEWMLILSKDANPSRRIPLSSWRGTVQSVYAAPPQRSNEFADSHAATMPTHLPMWVIQKLCDQSKMIFEPFCGTGTTIIACEQLGRKCRAIEISPAYVAVAIQRWADATGKRPRLIQ